jgi:hypothetical protein
MANRIPFSFLTDASAFDETKHQKVKGQRGKISMVACDNLRQLTVPA